MSETLEFDKAIETAVNMTSEEDTLIVVTADHSHSFVINGYAKRSNSIIGERAYIHNDVTNKQGESCIIK